MVAGGIDVAYPPENEALQDRIAAEGLLIAEMPPGIEPRARHFPHRNRIIAGLSLGTVVVEAAPRTYTIVDGKKVPNEAEQKLIEEMKAMRSAMPRKMPPT